MPTWIDVASKTVWTGIAMILAGLFAMVLPDMAASVGITTEPELLIGNGFGLIFIKDAVRKVAK